MVENVHYLSRDKHEKYSPISLASYIGMYNACSHRHLLEHKQVSEKIVNTISNGYPEDLAHEGSLFFLHIF